MANVIRQQSSQTSVPKARYELVEPSKKRALSPGRPREGRAMDKEGQALREMSKRKKWVADDCMTVEEDECSSDEEIGCDEIEDNLLKIRDDDPSAESTDDGPRGLNWMFNI